jgi:hypothetical protein
MSVADGAAGTGEAACGFFADRDASSESSPSRARFAKGDGSISCLSAGAISAPSPEGDGAAKELGLPDTSPALRLRSLAGESEGAEGAFEGASDPPFARNWSFTSCSIGPSAEP